MPSSTSSALMDESEAARKHVALVAASLNTRLASLVGQMRDALADQILELTGEPALIDLLGASIEGNVDTILHSLQYDISGDRFEQPAAAVEYARRLAQWGVPVNALVRAYRLGQQFLLQQAFETSQEIPTSDAVRFVAHEMLVNSVFDYIDWISQRVVGVYENEREAWLADRENARLDAVLDLLDGVGTVESTERVTGYRVRGRHLAVVAWADASAGAGDRLRRFTMSIRELATALRSPAAPLVIGRDGVTTWGWVQIPADVDANSVIAEMEHLARAEDAPLLAVGTVGTGVEGFVRSHREATRAHHVAVLGRRARTIERYDSPGLSVAELCAGDPAKMQSWVREVLGEELVADSNSAQRLRETLRIYLLHAGSLTAAATTMTMHKNSIRYRVDNAERLLPRPLDADRLAVEVALTICHWLGPVVLSPRAAS